jgi:hypothetical protein
MFALKHAILEQFVEGKECVVEPMQLSVRSSAFPMCTVCSGSGDSYLYRKRWRKSYAESKIREWMSKFVQSDWIVREIETLDG